MRAKTRDLIVTNLLAVALGLFTSGIFIALLGINPAAVFGRALGAIFTDRYLFGDVLLRATPLIFTALAFAFTFKAKLFNIGAQGQFYMGAIAAIAVSLQLDGRLPTPLLLFVVCLLTVAAGGLIGGGIGYLKARFGANEFLVSMMSTYVVLALMNYLLRTWLKEAKGEYPQTDSISMGARIPTLLPGTRLHAGFLLAVAVAVLIWVLLYKTPLGYRIRAVGNNRTAAEMSGINAKRVYIIAFAISGALAGMSGFTEVNGVQYMLLQDLGVGIGAAGIGIAILANAHPIGIVFAAILFGLLQVIGTYMGRMPGVNIPPSIIEIMQGFVMMFVIAAYFFRRKIEVRREKRKLQKGVA